MKAQRSRDKPPPLEVVKRAGLVPLVQGCRLHLTAQQPPKLNSLGTRLRGTRALAVADDAPDNTDSFDGKGSWCPRDPGGILPTWRLGPRDEGDHPKNCHSGQWLQCRWHGDR